MVVVTASVIAVLTSVPTQISAQAVSDIVRDTITTCLPTDSAGYRRAQPARRVRQRSPRPPRPRRAHPPVTRATLAPGSHAAGWSTAHSAVQSRSDEQAEHGGGVAFVGQSLKGAREVAGGAEGRGAAGAGVPVGRGPQLGFVEVQADD
jgi:hypothetical protein